MASPSAPWSCPTAILASRRNRAVSQRGSAGSASAMTRSAACPTSPGMSAGSTCTKTSSDCVHPQVIPAGSRPSSMPATPRARISRSAAASGLRPSAADPIRSRVAAAASPPRKAAISGAAPPHPSKSRASSVSATAASGRSKQIQPLASSSVTTPWSIRAAEAALSNSTAASSIEVFPAELGPNNTTRPSSGSRWSRIERNSATETPSRRAETTTLIRHVQAHPS